MFRALSIPFHLRVLQTLLAGVLFVAALSHTSAAAEPRTTFSNSISVFPKQALLTRRALVATKLKGKMEFEVSLKMRNYEELQARIATGEVIPRAEMLDRYLPLATDYTALTKWLKSQGLTLTRIDSSRLCVFVRGTVAQIQKALEVEMEEVTVDGVDYNAATTSPSLPTRLATPILGVNGLQPFNRRHKHAVFQPQTANKAPFLINEILKAYGATNLGVTGANQKIAILIDTVPLTSDITTFWTNNGVAQSTSNYETVNVNNLTLPATSGEETLDVQWSSGIAPGAKIRVYASGTLDDTNLDKAFQRIISDLPSQPQMHQLSISLGLGETYSTSAQFTTDSQFLATIAAGGVSIFVSSGDDGSTPSDSGTTGGPLQVEYYSSDPSVTAVGGTSLTLNSSTGAVTAETAWSGSGGGVSTIFARPSWQVGTGVPAGTKRCTPDVALAADPNTGAYVYYTDPTDSSASKVQTIGGTSWSAPTWAGFCALINQARANAGKGPLGLLNPSIYPLLGTSAFRDITSGNNAGGSKAGGKYVAAAGYDQVTGLGVPNVAALLQALVGASTISSFSPTSGLPNTSVVLTGTGFTSASAVKFNGTSATYTVNSDTQITTTVPNGATSGPVTVTAPSGTGTSGTSFIVLTGNGQPTIASFTPATGGINTSVVITGTNFGSVSAVKFNGTSATYNVDSGTQITAAVPSGATTGTITVTTAQGTVTSTGIFTITQGSSVVISQVYGGGGNANATYQNDFIELFNRGSSTVSLSGWSVQYASSSGTTWSTTPLTASIAPGRYYLVKEAGGSIGAVLPAQDVSGTLNMSGTSGKVALVNSTTALTASNPVGTSAVVDFVGYGNANAFEGTAAAPTLSNSLAAARIGGGSVDTDNNSGDFLASTPNARNSTVVPDLTIIASHTGAFTQGDQADTYTITVSDSGVGATGGAVTVVDNLPSGLTATAFAGTGWTTTLGTLTATRSDSLAPGTSFPPLTLTVSVATTAAASVTNISTVSGGAETNTANNTANDVTTIYTPLQGWRVRYFQTPENTGNAADTFVASSDGLPNLLKYAFNLDPLIPAANPVVLDTSIGVLRLSVPKNPAATDISYVPQVTGDLSSPSNWSSTGLTVEQNTPTLLRFHDNTAAAPPGARFIRVNITRP